MSTVGADEQDQTNWEAELGRVVERIRQLAAGYDRVQASKAPPGSIRHADDDATWPMAVGEHAQYCLMQAVDMCEGIEELVTNEHGLQLPLAATYPLARAAIESASLAVWMLSPPTRRARVVRRLQSARDEVVYEKHLARCIAEGAPSSAQQRSLRVAARAGKELRAYMLEIARVHDIDKAEYDGGLPGWASIVREAGAVIYSGRESTLEAAWRFASGLTHPSLMRGGLAHEFTRSDDSSDGTEGEFTADVRWVVSTARAAEALTRAGLITLERTKIRDNDEHPVAVPRRDVVSS